MRPVDPPRRDPVNRPIGRAALTARITRAHCSNPTCRRRAAGLRERLGKKHGAQPPEALREAMQGA